MVTHLQFTPPLPRLSDATAHPNLEPCTSKFQETELTVFANLAELRSRLSLDSLPRELHYQLILPDDFVPVAKGMLSALLGISLTNAEAITDVRMRRTTRLSQDSGELQTSYELTGKTDKIKVGGVKSSRSEYSIAISSEKFSEIESLYPPVGRLSKMRLSHQCGKIASNENAVVAEIDYILGAGLLTLPPDENLVCAERLPESPLRVVPIDFEVTTPELIEHVHLDIDCLSFLKGIALDPERLNVPKQVYKSVIRPLTKSRLSTYGIGQDADTGQTWMLRKMEKMAKETMESVTAA